MASPKTYFMAQNKTNGSTAKSSSKPNTPSNIDTSFTTDSPIATPLSSAFNNLFAIRSLRRSWPFAPHSPKIKTPHRVDSPIPTKENKKKTKGVPNQFKSTKAKGQSKRHKANGPSKSSYLSNVAPDTTIECRPSSKKGKPKQTPTQFNDPNINYRCIVCNKGELHMKTCRDHFKGHPHGQMAGLLEAYKDRDTVQPASDLLRTGGRWYCHSCDGSIPPPHNADRLQTHLRAHMNDIARRWEAFKEMARGVVGLRENEIPKEVEKSFIPDSQGKPEE